MKDCSFTVKTEIAALFLEYPVLEKIRDNRRVTVIHIKPAADIVEFGPPCANGFNVTGWIFRIVNENILSETTWDEIRKKQKELGLRDSEENTARTILTGEEDTIVFVQEHHEEDRYDNKWISMDVFMCGSGKTFVHYPQVMVWVKQLEIRKRVGEILI